MTLSVAYYRSHRSIAALAAALLLILLTTGLVAPAYARGGQPVVNPTISSAYSYEVGGRPVFNNASDSLEEILHGDFQGQERIAGTNLYNFGPRQLDAESGDFTQLDPEESTGDLRDINGYAYAYRDAVNVFDRSGLAETCPDDGLGSGCPSAAQAPPDNKPSLPSPLPFSPTLGLIPDSLLNAPPSDFPQPQTIEDIVRASLFLAMFNPAGGALGLGGSLGAGIIDNQLFGGGIKTSPGFLILATGGKMSTVRLAGTTMQGLQLIEGAVARDPTKYLISVRTADEIAAMPKYIPAHNLLSGKFPKELDRWIEAFKSDGPWQHIDGGPAVSDINLISRVPWAPLFSGAELQSALDLAGSLSQAGRRAHLGINGDSFIKLAQELSGVDFAAPVLATGGLGGPAFETLVILLP